MIAAVAAATLVVTWPHLGHLGRWLAGGATATLVHPLAGLAAALALPVIGHTKPTPGSDILALTDHVALSLRAGLNLENSLVGARSLLEGPLRSEVGGMLREARRSGIERALNSTAGIGSRLYRITERAARTGAPLLDAVDALASELRAEDHARRLAAARRLPVRLLLPLALLILPGFVLALVGPAVTSSLARLDIG